jgi:alpha/beta superfamily hydrolase
MQVPSILQGESRTRLLQGIAIGAVTSMVIGFSWGGWVTGSTANRLAAEEADTAVVAALTPICVEKFLQNGDAKANLAILQKISSNCPTSTWRGRAQRSWCKPKLPPNELKL